MPRTPRTRKPLEAKRPNARVGARWQLQEAKARLSQLVKDAQKKPQIITLHGEAVAVVQSIKEYRESRGNEGNGSNLFEALLQCPPGPSLVIERNPEDVVGAGTRSIFE